MNKNYTKVFSATGSIKTILKNREDCIAHAKLAYQAYESKGYNADHLTRCVSALDSVNQSKIASLFAPIATKMVKAGRIGRDGLTAKTAKRTPINAKEAIELFDEAIEAMGSGERTEAQAFTSNLKRGITALAKSVKDFDQIVSNDEQYLELVALANKITSEVNKRKPKAAAKPKAKAKPKAAVKPKAAAKPKAKAKPKAAAKPQAKAKPQAIGVKNTTIKTAMVKAAAKAA